MEINIKDNGCVVRNKEKVFTDILQEFFTKECFCMVKNQALVL